MMQNVDSNPSRSSSILRSRSEKEEREAQQILTKLFNEVDAWHAMVAGSLQVSPQSALGIADELSAPLQASHAVGYLRLTAVDHLHALKTLIRDAQSQHIFAPFSLIRSVLESASTALWILSDADPRTIAVRSLKQEWVNLRDLGNAHQTAGAPEKDIVVRRELLNKVIGKNHLEKEGIKANPPGSLKIIQTACDDFELGSAPVMMWQMCSAATHGRKWITGFLTMMEGRDDGVSKVISGRLTSDVQAIVLAAYAACDVVRRLFSVIDIRAKPESHTGASFQKETSALLVPPRRLYLPTKHSPN